MNRTTPETTMDSLPADAARRPQTEELWRQLSNVIAMRTARDQVLWNLSAIFWGVNAVLLVALFQTGGLPSDPWVGCTVAVIGVALCLVWHTLQTRLLNYLRMDEHLMLRIERELRIEPTFAISPALNTIEAANFLKKGVPAKLMLKRSSVVAVCLWLAAVAFFIWTLIVHA